MQLSRTVGIYIVNWNLHFGIWVMSYVGSPPLSSTYNLEFVRATKLGKLKRGFMWSNGQLEEVAQTCNLCWRESESLHCFCIAPPDYFLFSNHTIFLYLMSILINAVLHNVHEDTKFSAATLLAQRSATAIWERFMHIWIMKYTGGPDVYFIHQKPQFRSQKWKSVQLATGVKLQASGVESDNALETRGRYHSFLRKWFERITTED